MRRLRRIIPSVVVVAGLAALAVWALSDRQPWSPPVSASRPAAAPDAGAKPPPTDAALAALAPEARPDLEWQPITVRRGDTLIALLLDAGVPRADAHGAIASLGAIYNPRDLRIGQEVVLVFRAGGRSRPRFRGLRLDAAEDRTVSVIRDDAGEFAASQTIRPLTRELVTARGRIDSSLYLSAKAAAVPIPVIVAMIRLFSFDVDFQRELRPGDGFEVAYERFRFADGGIARNGAIIHAALTVSGRRLALYRFAPRDGKLDYYDAAGRGARKALMRTPIDGARLSSRFGRRRHPIKGYTAMHRGVDFAAPRGTPIYAAGDGVVTRVGRNGGYGKYIRIRHNDTYGTAYAHLGRFAKGLARRKRVRQGQVIGFVGSTGASTGPHLHYEILRRGAQINPLSLKMPSGEQLGGAELAAFEARRAEIDAQIAALATSPGDVARGGLTPPRPGPLLR